MANLRCSIWVYRKIGGKWKYCKPAVGRNNKLVPEEGTYYIRWREGSKLRWRKSSSAANAVADAKRQEAYLNAHAHGLTLAQQNPATPEPLQMVYAMPTYLEEYKLSNRPESYNLMKQTLEEFHAHCRKNLISAIIRLDLLRYKEWLISKKRSPRTAGNKMLRVAQFLRTIQKQKPGEGLVTVKDARWVELEPEVYTEKELAAFFYYCTPFQYGVFKTLLMSGLRKAELETLTWQDVDLDAGTLKVCAKAEFSPKSWEERTIEIPTELVNILKELPRKSRWVFANGAGNRYTHMWDDAKVIGKKAKIANCHPHKFRSTFATRLLHGGMDLKTVQKLLGHKNLESTMRYLAKAPTATKLVFVEAKVVSYIDSMQSTLQSAGARWGMTQIGFNSSINGQLSLKYRFAKALSRWDGNTPAISESPVVFAAYRSRLNDSAAKAPGRTLAKPSILNRILKPLALSGIGEEHCCYVALTWDTTSNAFFSSHEVPVDCLPVFLNETGVDILRDATNRVGWIGYRHLNDALGLLNSSEYVTAFSTMLDAPEPPASYYAEKRKGRWNTFPQHIVKLRQKAGA